MEGELQEWLKGEYVKVRMVAMGGHWLERIIHGKRKVGLAFAEWKRGMYMTRTNSVLSKRLGHIMKLSRDFEANMSED